MKIKPFDILYLRSKISSSVCGVETLYYRKEEILFYCNYIHRGLWCMCVICWGNINIRVMKWHDIRPLSVYLSLVLISFKSFV